MMSDVPDTVNALPGARHPVATEVHRWLRTAELGAVFLLFALLAEFAGLAHDEATSRVARRPAATRAGQGPGPTSLPGRAMAVAARPAALR